MRLDKATGSSGLTNSNNNPSPDGGMNNNTPCGFAPLQHGSISPHAASPLHPSPSSPVDQHSNYYYRSDLNLLAERIHSSSSSCSIVATVGTPSSPRSIRSGISSISHHGICVPLSHTSGAHAVGGGASSTGVTVNSDLSIQQHSVPYASGGGVYSPPAPFPRPPRASKRPSSSLSDEGSFHLSTVVAVGGDSLPRDDELTTMGDDEELTSSRDEDPNEEDGRGSFHRHHHVEHKTTAAEQQQHTTSDLLKSGHQSSTPIRLSAREKNGDDGSSSLMGGRKGFESSNYADNLDELGCFTVRVEGPELKFSCAHFVAYSGYRERLHGHTYQVKLMMGGRLNADGYVVDFNMCKRVVRDTCKTFNEYMIIPMRSDVLSIKTENGSVRVITETGDQFIFPESDCLCLPIMHSTAEELAAHFWNVVLLAFTPQYLQLRGVTWLEISIAERPTQEAQYRRHIPVPPQF